MHKDNIFKPVSYLLLISAIVAIINFVYNVLMSRMLTVPDFGDLRALFSILMILIVPLSAIQTMLAKFTAEYYKINLARLKSLSIQTLALILALGFIFIITFGLFRHPIANYLRISSANLVALLGPLMLIALIQPVILGIYQGLQRFILFGLNTLIATILKLVLGVTFVYLGFATLGALYGLILSGILIIVIFAPLLIPLFAQDQGPKDISSRQDIYTYSGYALGVLICFSIISQIDILIVKHKFLPTEAGYYAASAVIGKGFLLLPVPVVTVLFPKVVQNNKIGRSSLPILIQSLFISLLLCIIGIIICFYFSDYLIKIFGHKYAEAGDLLKIFGLAMTPFALFYVLMHYFLSEYRLKFFYYCLLVCILGVVVLFFLCRTLQQFLFILGGFGSLIFILPLVYIFIKEKKVAYGVG